jgi:hypothetical protein
MKETSCQMTTSGSISKFGQTKEITLIGQKKRALSGPVLEFKREE